MNYTGYLWTAGDQQGWFGPLGLEADKLPKFLCLRWKDWGKVDTAREISRGSSTPYGGELPRGGEWSQQVLRWPHLFGGEGALAPGRPASPLVIRKILLYFYDYFCSEYEIIRLTFGLCLFFGCWNLVFILFSYLLHVIEMTEVSEKRWHFLREMSSLYNKESWIWQHRWRYVKKPAMIKRGLVYWIW